MTRKLYCFKQVLILLLFFLTVKILKLFDLFSIIKHIMGTVDHSGGGRGYINGIIDICIQERRNRDRMEDIFSSL